MQQKLKWIVPSVIVGVGVLVWGVLQYLGGSAEARLRDALAEYGLQHRVHWQGISASFGGVTLNGVRFDLDGEDGWQAERVKVSDLTDTQDRQRITLHIEGLAEFGAQGTTSVLDTIVGLPSGKANLPPLDAHVKLDVRYDKDAAELSLVLNQKDALNVDVHMALTRIDALRTLTRAAVAADAPARGARRSAANTRRLAQDVLDWTAIHLKALDAKLEDRGMIKRGIALYKRHNIALDVDGGSVKSQQNKEFAQIIQNLETRCRKDKAALRTKDAEQTCRALARFLSNDKNTLRVSMAPRDPVPLVQALAEYIPVLAFFSDAPSLPTRVLNVEVKS